MNGRQWEIIKKSAAMETFEKPPVAFIIDSPWLPGYAGITTADYFTLPDIWLETNIKVKREFPEAIFIPDFWVEFGMAAEPTGFGCRVQFYENSTPTVSHIFKSSEELEKVDDLEIPNPKTDGLMPLILNLYKKMNKKVKDLGEDIKIVAARGPLTAASHLMGMTEFLIGLKTDKKNTHKLLAKTTALVKRWLESQAEALTDAEGILVLDDTVGFLSKEDYLEFAHPYLKDIYSSFPGFVAMFHNDTDNPVCYEFLEDIGIKIFNFTHLQNIAEVRKRAGNKVCLMGNVPPLDVLSQGMAEQVRNATVQCMKDYGGKSGLILSAGGGVSPGTPAANIRAFIDAVKNI